MLMFCIISIAVMMTGVGSDPTGNCGNNVQFDASPGDVTTCTENEDCDGLSCAISAAGVSYNFHVINCEDPVLVNFTTTYGGTPSSMVFNQSFADGTSGLNFTMYRNASHIFIHATVSQNGAEYRVIPHTIVSLNASYCMCQSIKSIANADANEAVPLTCTNNTNCTGLDCTSSALPTYKFETDVKPCTNPPGIDLIIRNTVTSIQVYHGFFSNSTNATLPVIGNLHVHIRHGQYSMTVSVELQVISGSLYELVPPTQIILDKSHCGKGSNHSNPTTPTPKPHPTNPPSNVVDPQVCYSLQKVANTYCHTNTQCDSLICNSPSGYWSQIQIIPCDNPPAVHITLHNKTGGVFYDRILTNSTNITIPSPVTQMQIVFAVVIKNDSVSLEVHTTFLGRRIELLPPATIPINKCYCGNDTSTCTPYNTISTLPASMSTTTIIYTLPPVPSPSVTSLSHSPVIYTLPPIPSPSTNSSMLIVTSSSSSSPTIKGQSIGILLVEILVPLIVGISIIILLVLVILLVGVRVWRYKRGQGTMYSRLARGVITMDDESNDTL